MEKASVFMESFPDTQARFQRVVKLIHCFAPPFGMELLSTVHWVCSREEAASNEEATRRTSSWNDRKRAFTPDQIALAREVLLTQGWLPAAHQS